MNLFKWFKKEKHKNIDTNILPSHIGIIMDGNGRWAKKRGLPRSAGHKAGTSALEKIVEFCSELGIEVLTVYAFSTENWKRPKNEVDSLMDLLKQYLTDCPKKLADKNIRIKIIGDFFELDEDIKELIYNAQECSKNNDGLILNIAINYGGRKEILYGVKEIAKEIKNGTMKIEDIDEDTFSKHLYTSHCKDPDLIIRPSGELRTSNFLLWQSAYSEFWYSKILWPDFKPKDLIKAIADFQNRDRRFGGI